MWKSPRYDEAMGVQANTAPAPTAEATRETGERLATLPRSDRQGGESELRVTLDEFQGHPFVSVRIWNQDKASGAWFPTRKGCSIRLSEIDDVQEALAAAQRLSDRRRPNPPAGVGKSRGGAARGLESQGDVRPSDGSGGDFDEFQDGE